jgi:hypothetical protein
VTAFERSCDAALKEDPVPKMTMRERMLAVVQGKEHDRVPFVQYSGVAAPDDEVWALVGRDNVGLLRWQSLYRTERPNCRCETEEFVRDGRRGYRATLHSPAGSLTEERVYQPDLGVAAVREHFVKEPGDYEVLLAILKDTWVFDCSDEIERHNAELGDDGFCHVSVERTPYQQLWIIWVSLADLALHLVDCPEVVDECVREMIRIQREIYRFLPLARIPYVVIPDNITAPTIGDRYFRRYCLPLYQELVGIAEEQGSLVYVHMDGDLKPLAKAIAESGIGGIDSLSPPPDNDTSAAEAAALWPQMRLGVNFPSSVHLSGPQAIYDAATEILNQAGHTGRLQIQISENPPPGAWRKSYPQIVRAIGEFGPP